VSGFDAVVIGAGCAGLSAATALAEAGARVAVVEARPMAGGRTFATADRVTGDWVDNGQHVLFGCYHDTLAYLARIGTRRKVRVQSALAVPMIDRRGRQSELRCPALPSPLQLAAGVLAWDALSWSERVAVARLGPALDPAAPPPAPEETVRRWLIRHGQPARLCDLLWEPLAVAALNQPIDQATATTFVEVVRRRLGPEPDDAALVIPAESLSHVLIDPAVAFVEARGGEVLRGARARVVVSDRGAIGVDVRGRVINAPYVVSSVPWHAVAALFHEVAAPLAPIVHRASTMRSAPIVTVNLWFDRPVLEAPFIGLPGRAFQWVFDKRLVAPGQGTHLSLVCSGADEVVGLENDAIIERALTEFTAAVPAATRARLMRATAVRERRATFSLAAGEPVRPATATPLPGFLLAGDWTDTGLPATIESAVVSGRRAARVITGRGHA
jgi:squalene-associated FAD-dependent desaturase